MNNPVITIKVRDLGNIVVELYPNVARNTVNNFLKYASEGFYNGLIFHRVIPAFMIQGGGNEKIKSFPIKGEFMRNGVENNLAHTRGVISMARTNDPNSATSQFFIMHGDSPHLDGNYASFGKTISGDDIVDLIANTPRDSFDRPKNDVVIESITVDLNGYAPQEVVYIK